MRTSFVSSTLLPLQRPGQILASSLFLLATAQADHGPLRIAYVDPDAAEESRAGLLHRLMREQGRQAIYFDYFPSPEALSADLSKRYHAVALPERAQSGTPNGAERFLRLHPEKKVLFLAEAQTDEAVRTAILQTVGDRARKDWVAFLAAREEEVREPNQNVANYEKRPQPLTLQKPLSAKGSLARIQVPADLRVEVFAESPQIGKPIAMSWDARGRCWVATTFDYPHGVTPDSVGNDKIIICEDTDGDGKADKFTTFADKLNIPTGLCFVNGGLMVAQPPHFVFLKDTNGDNVADVRETVFTGMWGVGDTHAQASNLHYGYDNWLYGAVGYSGFKGNVGGKQLEFRMGSYRFQADGSRLEFLHQFTNNTWGQGYNEAGDQFGGTANNAPLFYGGIPHTMFPAGVRGMSAMRINAVAEAHPITPNFRQVDVFGGYTAAAGSSFVYSASLPARMQGCALVCEPTMKLVSLFDVRPEGAGYRAFDRMNLFASSDEWTSPVYAEVGPDGAVWIADWQNFIIQHNPTPSEERGGYKAVTGPGGAHENPLRDHERGRIYRVLAADAKPAKLRPLEGAPVEEVVAALGSDTQFWRLTAQRLLVEGRKTEAVPRLKAIAVSKDAPIAAIHALWTLHGLGQLDAETHRAALASPDARVRRNAVRALDGGEQARALFFGSGVITDADAHTRLAAWVKMAEFPTTPELRKTVRALGLNMVSIKDEWLGEASRMLARRHGAELFTEGPNLLPNPGLENIGPDGLPEGWQRRDYNPRSRGDAVRWESVEGGKNVHSGNRAVRATAADLVDTSLHADVPLKPHRSYKLSTWVRGKGMRGKLSLNDHIGRAETEKLTKDGDWQLLETTFESGERTKASINILFVAKGEGYFDDVRLVELTPVADAALAAGDARRGEEIFRKHPTAACVLCHALQGAGSNVGPALDGIAARKDAAYIRQSLLEPNAVLATGYEYLKVSPMPAMNLILSPQEIEDVQAFLQTLK
jgi:putative membrane-bound dehydrogenase-like protein